MKSLFKEGTKTPAGMCCIALSAAGISAAHVMPESPFIASATFMPTEENENLSVLSHWIKAEKLNGMSCACVLSSQDYRLILLDAPNLAEDELKSAAPWLVKDLIDYPIEEAVVEVFQIPVKVGDVAKIYIVVTKKEKLYQLKNQIFQLGLALVKVDILELALAQGFSVLNLEGRSVGLLYEDAGLLQFMIVKDQLIHLIRKVGEKTALSDETLMDSVLLECQRSLDFYQTGMRQQAITQLYVMPSLYKSDLLTTRLNAQLTVSVAEFNVIESLQIQAPPESVVVIGEGLGCYAAED